MNEDERYLRKSMGEVNDESLFLRRVEVSG
jgi:hypothetical protein